MVSDGLDLMLVLSFHAMFDKAEAVRKVARRSLGQSQDVLCRPVTTHPPFFHAQLHTFKSARLRRLQ